VASPATTSYTDVGLANGTTYFYVVTAVNAIGESANSNQASATPQGPPTALTATAVSNSQINLAWIDNSTNEDGFKIERCQGNGCTSFVQTAQVGASVTTYSNTGLASLTTYVYRVRAFNSLGNSAYSNNSSAKTKNK
jgi:fibronectin type 3 domain-containing protein